MVDLNAISRTLDAGTVGCDPVAQIQLTPEELQSIIYQAKLQKWQEQKAAMAGKIREQNMAIFSQPWTAERYRELIEWKASVYHFKDGSSFTIDEDNEKVIEALCLYFTNDPRFAPYGKKHFNCDNWSLEKAILLRGESGRGKTSLMELFAGNPKMSFEMVPAQVIRNRVKDIGDRVIHAYLLGRSEPAGNYQCFYQTRIALCIDDFGIEDHMCMEIA